MLVDRGKTVQGRHRESPLQQTAGVHKNLDFKLSLHYPNSNPDCEESHQNPEQLVAVEEREKGGKSELKKTAKLKGLRRGEAR